MKYIPLILVGAVAIIVLIGSMRNPNYWLTPDQRGDSLLRRGQFAQAAKSYTDPQRIGVAQYRNGDFEAAAKTFARVPGANGAYDQANAQLMHGQYAQAIASYDRALAFRPDWTEARENKAIAIARKARLDASSKTREQEQAGAYDPDEIRFDQKGTDRSDKTNDLSQQEVSDEELRATWLRQVRTTPADFLRAKFAYQAAHQNVQEPAP